MFMSSWRNLTGVDGLKDVLKELLMPQEFEHDFKNGVSWICLC